MRQRFLATLITSLSLLVAACTTPSGGNPRTPAASDEASDRLHDRKVHDFIDRVDTRASR